MPMPNAILTEPVTAKMILCTFSRRVAVYANTDHNMQTTDTMPRIMPTPKITMTPKPILSVLTVANVKSINAAVPPSSCITPVRADLRCLPFLSSWPVSCECEWGKMCICEGSVSASRGCGYEQGNGGVIFRLCVVGDGSIRELVV
jgi:hypothetical protein